MHRSCGYYFKDYDMEKPQCVSFSAMGTVANSVR
jgi:hypothetical protein